MSYLRDVFWRLGHCWRSARGSYTLYVLGTLLLATYPALNVLVIGYLGEQIATNGSIQFAILYLILLFGLYNTYFMIMVSFTRCFMVRIAFGAYRELGQHAAQTSARLYSDQAYLDELLQAYGAVRYNQIAQQNSAILSLFSALFTAVTLCWSLWNYNPVVAVLTMILPIPVVATNLIYGKFEGKYWPLINAQERRAEYLQDQMASDRTGFDLSSMRASSSLAVVAQAVYQQLVRLQMRLSLICLSFASLTGGLTVAMYAVCLYLLITQGDLVTLLTGIFGMAAVLSCMVGMSYHVGMLMEAIPSNRTYRHYLERQIQPVQLLSPAQAEEVSFTKVHVSYGDKEVVHGVNLELSRNRLTALVGANGSGKTTLVKALMGAQVAVTGTATLGDQVWDMNDASRALNFATVNQEFQRFDLTVREFLTLGLTRSVSDAELWDVLEKVEFAAYVRSLPQALDTATGVQWGGVDLSGGQWQRLCVARGMLSDAGLLFLDEPTSAIDAPTEERIFGHLAQLSANRLILLTTHRVSTLREAEMIYVMEQGNIVESGSFAELNRPGTAFRRLFESQFVEAAESEGVAQEATVSAPAQA